MGFICCKLTQILFIFYIFVLNLNYVLIYFAMQSEVVFPGQGSLKEKFPLGTIYHDSEIPSVYPL